MIEIGRHKLIVGDCVEVMQGMPDESVHLCVTSPPYGALRDYDGYMFRFEETARQISRLLVPGGVCVWVVGDSTASGSETLAPFKQAIYFKDTLGMRVHDTMIMRKPGMQYPESSRYYNCFEYMFVFSKGRPRIIQLLRDRPNKRFGEKIHGGETKKDGKRLLRSGEKNGRSVGKFGVRWNVWDVNTSGARGYWNEHPATFPISLAKDHILTWSTNGDTIIDPFCGSGTTIAAAEITNRNGIGIDMSEKYIRTIAARRVADAMRDLPNQILL